MKEMGYRSMEYTKVQQQMNNIVGDNVKKLAQLFPAAVKDGEVDFEALKEELGQFKEVGSEKYELTWAGKKNAKKIAQTSISAAMINITVDLLLIRKIHIFAASFSTLAAFLILFFVRYRDVNRTVRMKLKCSVVIGCLLMGGFLIYTYYCGNRLIQAGALVVTVIYAIATNWDMLRMGIQLVRSKLHRK